MFAKAAPPDNDDRPVRLWEVSLRGSDLADRV